LQLYGFRYEHRPWSVWADAERIAPHSPLGRVPVLVLDDGESLVDSVSILDFLDGEVGTERALYPASGALRRQALRVTALATGFADKAVSLFYEVLLHPSVSDQWIARCLGQIERTLFVLEKDRAERKTPYCRSS
jgi:glutathione S-transferase